MANLFYLLKKCSALQYLSNSVIIYNLLKRTHWEIFENTSTTNYFGIEFTYLYSFLASSTVPRRLSHRQAFAMACFKTSSCSIFAPFDFLLKIWKQYLFTTGIEVTKKHLKSGIKFSNTNIVNLGLKPFQMQ